MGVDGRAAEALNSMEEEVINMASENIPMDTRHEKQKQSSQELDRESKDMPKYLLGKSYFDCKEYDRAAFVLESCQGLKCKFLKLYSKYLVVTAGSRLTFRPARN